MRRAMREKECAYCKDMSVTGVSQAERITYLHRSKVAVRMLGGHAHLRVHRGRRRRAVRGTCRARVVLTAAPAKSNTRVADRVPLHLVDGHLGSVTLHKLDEAAALAGRDLDVGDLSEALEERTKLILRDITAESTDENSGVVGVGELVHGLRSAIVAATATAAAASHLRRCAHGVHT